MYLCQQIYILLEFMLCKVNKIYAKSSTVFCNTPFGGQLFHFQGGMGDFRKHILQTDFKGKEINSYNEKQNLWWLIMLERIFAPLYVREKFYQ